MKYISRCLKIYLIILFKQQINYKNKKISSKQKETNKKQDSVTKHE